MAQTPDGTPYVEGSDFVSGYPAVSQALAEQIDALRRMQPVGMIAPYAGELNSADDLAAIDGWLPCDGKAYKRADFPDLYTRMSTWQVHTGFPPDTPGGSPSTSNFYVPDMRGRAPFGTGGTETANTHQLGERGGDWRMQFHTHNVVYRNDGNLITFFGNTTTDSNPAQETKMGVNRDAAYDPDAAHQPVNSMLAREPKRWDSGNESIETNPLTSMPPFTGVNFIVWTGTTTTGKSPISGVEVAPLTTRMMIEARLEEAGISEDEIEMLREHLAALKDGGK